MLIQCTKKLLDRIHVFVDERTTGISAEDGLENPDFFCWHANVITVGRRKVLFFVNNLTRLAVIAYRPKPGVYKQLPQILENGIRELFGTLGVHPEVTELYLQKAGEMRITSTGTRSQIARMNKIGEEACWQSRYFREDRLLQTAASVSMAGMPVTEGKDYFIPKKRLFGALCQMQELAEEDWDQVRSCKSYVMRIALDLEHFNIYRLIEAPVTATFYQLHEAIQRSFGWFGYHLHNFSVYEDKISVGSRAVRGYITPTMIILDSRDPEAEYYHDKDKYGIAKDFGMMLCDVFEDHDTCEYTYDFGDSWEHVITIEERRQKDGSIRFRLLERQGERPPEDVGGETGFEEYMRIISNPDDPEYEEMKRWVEGTRAPEEALEEINRKLGYLG